MLRLSLLRRLRRDRRGGAMVEWALVAPMLIMLLLGSVDLGRYVWIRASLDHAAREGARYASLRGAESDVPATSDEIAAYVVQRAAAIPTAAATVAVLWSPDNYPGSSVTVRVEYRFHFLSLGVLGREPLEMAGRASLIVL